MSETDLVTTTIEVLNLEPRVLAMRNNVGSVRRKGHFLTYGLGTGSADIIVCAAGVFVALEAKLPKEEQRESQKEWQAKLQRAGGIYAVFYTVEEARRIVRLAMAA